MSQEEEKCNCGDDSALNDLRMILRQKTALSNLTLLDITNVIQSRIKAKEHFCLNEIQQLGTDISNHIDNLVILRTALESILRVAVESSAEETEIDKDLN